MAWSSCPYWTMNRPQTLTRMCNPSENITDQMRGRKPSFDEKYMTCFCLAKVLIDNFKGRAVYDLYCNQPPGANNLFWLHSWPEVPVQRVLWIWRAYCNATVDFLVSSLSGSSAKLMQQVRVSTTHTVQERLEYVEKSQPSIVYVNNYNDGDNELCIFSWLWTPSGPVWPKNVNTDASGLNRQRAGWQ